MNKWLLLFSPLSCELHASSSATLERFKIEFGKEAERGECLEVTLQDVSQHMNAFAYFLVVFQTHRLWFHFTSLSLWFHHTVFHFFPLISCLLPTKTRVLGYLPCVNLAPINVMFTAAVLLGIKDKVMFDLTWAESSPVQGQNHVPAIESLFICANMRSWQKIWLALLFVLYAALQNLIPQRHDCRANVIQEAAPSKCCQRWLSLSAPCMFHLRSFLLRLSLQNGWRIRRTNTSGLKISSWYRFFSSHVAGFSRHQRT